MAERQQRQQRLRHRTCDLDEEDWLGSSIMAQRDMRKDMSATGMRARVSDGTLEMNHYRCSHPPEVLHLRPTSLQGAVNIPCSRQLFVSALRDAFNNDASVPQVGMQRLFLLLLTFLCTLVPSHIQRGHHANVRARRAEHCRPRKL